MGPVYQNNATKEFLFYTTVGSEWLVGPDFRKPHAGIQVKIFFFKNLILYYFEETYSGLQKNSSSYYQKLESKL